MSYTTRLHELNRILKENPNCTGIVCERSPDADRHIFAKMLHSDGCMEDVEFEIYNRYFQLCSDKLQIGAVIYWNVPPEACMQRIHKRCRDGESGIPIEYLQKCHDYHSAWLDNTSVKMLRLNGDVEVESDDYQQNLIQIEEFLQCI
jgi:deoxyadenosine/deoxycytidine kinase